MESVEYNVSYGHARFRYAPVNANIFLYNQQDTLAVRLRFCASSVWWIVDRVCIIYDACMGFWRFDGVLLVRSARGRLEDRGGRKAFQPERQRQPLCVYFLEINNTLSIYDHLISTAQWLCAMNNTGFWLFAGVLFLPDVQGAAFEDRGGRKAF